MLSLAKESVEGDVGCRDTRRRWGVSKVSVRFHGNGALVPRPGEVSPFAQKKASPSRPSTVNSLKKRANGL